MSTKRERILQADDIESEVVPVQQWGGEEVEVRGMSGFERARFMKRVTASGETDFEKFFAELIIATSYDPETGDKVFEPADRDALNAKSGAALNELAEVAMRLSGLASKAVEDAAEDFGETPRS